MSEEVLARASVQRATLTATGEADGSQLLRVVVTTTGKQTFAKLLRGAELARLRALFAQWDTDADGVVRAARSSPSPARPRSHCQCPPRARA